MKNYGIILSAGSSTRFGGTIKKQFYEIKNKPVLFYSLNAFNSSKNIDEIVLVSSKEDIKNVENFVKENGFSKVKNIVEGGVTRQESVNEGLKVLKEEGNVLIHDAARPLVDEEIIINLLEALKEYDGAVPAMKVVDTLIKVENNKLISYEDRDKMYQIQTPQAFRIDTIKEAHKKYQGKNASDDTQLIKLIGKEIKIIPGKSQLLKITKQEDISAIEAYINKNEYLQN